ncbi:MAG: hypothetical protein WCC44_02195 [Azonexus sp.]
MTKPKKKLVFGIGRNDADYVVCPRGPDGKRAKCPYYRTWSHMLERCYSPARHAHNPTYIGCSVVPGWHSFMAFKSWMETQDWQGKHLDKDILVPGNRTYGPDTCLFVTPAINTLLLDSAAQRGALLLGVCLDHGRYRANCRIDGHQLYFGMFNTPAEAHRAWQIAKLAALNDAWLQEPDPRVCRALVRIAGNLLDDIDAGRETVAFGIVADQINAVIDAAVAKARTTVSPVAAEAARRIQA